MNKVRIQIGEIIKFSDYEEFELTELITILASLKGQGATHIDICRPDSDYSQLEAVAFMERDETKEEIEAKAKEGRRLRVLAQINQEKVERQMLAALKKKYEPNLNV
jgi:hypothetical protein